MADDPARRCPYCGIIVPTGGHSGCPGLFREVMAEGFEMPAGHAMPQEAAAVRDDPSRALNQYLLVKVAGRGGMGEVWKAWDLKLERWVAIKFLLGASEADAARFLREARLAARLRHPNIAVVHEVGAEPPGRQFLVMDFVDGETLASARLDLEPALRIFAAVARAVDAAHRAGIIHRDLKPQNILLTREGWPFVTDFGLAKPIAPGRSLSASGTIMGTPAFMPPEQARGTLSEIDERSDVYSLGATFYRVLTGSDPFEAPTALEVLRLVTEIEPRAPRERNPKIPLPVDTVLRKCLSKAKAGRYPTAADLAEDLERILSGTRIRGRAPGPFATAFRRVRRSAVSLLLSAALVVLGAIAAWREWRDRSPRTPLLRPAEEVREASPSPAPAPAGRTGRTLQEETAASFVRSLLDVPTLDQLARKSRADLERALLAPEGKELGDPAPPLRWIRRARPQILHLRDGRGDPGELLQLLGSAIPIEESGGPPAFRALWPLAAEHVGLEISREARAAADLGRDEREEFRRRVDEILNQWRAFVGAVPPDFRRRHPEVDALDHELLRRAAEFPSPLPELDAVDLRACLKSPDPEQELERTRKLLIAYEARPGVDVESRRKLETLIVLASAYRSLLKGATEDEVVRDLADAGARLRKLGGAADPGDVSPRVRRILDSLLGR